MMLVLQTQGTTPEAREAQLRKTCLSLLEHRARTAERRSPQTLLLISKQKTSTKTNTVCSIISSRGFVCCSGQFFSSDPG